MKQHNLALAEPWNESNHLLPGFDDAAQPGKDNLIDTKKPGCYNDRNE